jgi:hypothetical protein
MEFLDNHSVITKIEFDKIKLLVIDSFQSFYYEEREFRYVIDNTGRLINEKFSVTSELKKFITIDSYDIYQMYINAFSNYSNKMIYNEKCKSVLKFEIYDYYCKFKEEDNPFKIPFEDFVTYLLKYVISRIIIHRLKKNSNLYELYYDNNYFDNFYLDHIDGHVFNSLAYKKIFKKFNPDKEFPCVIEKKDEYGNIKYEITVDNNLVSKSKKINKFLVQYKNLVNDLTIDEKLILIHISLSTDNKIDIPEKIKLNILTGGINDFRIFEESSNNNLVYNKVTKGMKYPYKKEKKIAIIESILYKIKICNLTKSNEALTSLLYNINKK